MHLLPNTLYLFFLILSFASKKSNESLRPVFPTVFPVYLISLWPMLYDLKREMKEIYLLDKLTEGDFIYPKVQQPALIELLSLASCSIIIATHTYTHTHPCMYYITHMHIRIHKWRLLYAQVTQTAYCLNCNYCKLLRAKHGIIVDAMVNFQPLLELNARFLSAYHRYVMSHSLYSPLYVALVS